MCWILMRCNNREASEQEAEAVSAQGEQKTPNLHNKVLMRFLNASQCLTSGFNLSAKCFYHWWTAFNTLMSERSECPFRSLMHWSSGSFENLMIVCTVELEKDKKNFSAGNLFFNVLMCWYAVNLLGFFDVHFTRFVYHEWFFFLSQHYYLIFTLLIILKCASWLKVMSKYFQTKLDWWDT